jgi:hypothetical protein
MTKDKFCCVYKEHNSSHPAHSVVTILADLSPHKIVLNLFIWLNNKISESEETDSTSSEKVIFSLSM